MKIAVFTHYAYPHVGGIEAVMQNQVQALARRGEKVRVVTSSCNAAIGEHEEDGVLYRRVPAWNYTEEKMGAAFPIFSPSLLYHSYKAVRYADVVHTHDAFYLTSLAAAFWCFVLRKPLVLTQHVDLIPHPSALVRFVQKAVYGTTGRFIMSVSKKILILNSRVKQFLIDIGVDEKKIVFVPNGIDTDIFSPTDESEKRRIREKYNVSRSVIIASFVGRFVSKKGYEKLCTLPKIDGLEIVFAGGDAPAGNARKDHVFIGKIGREDMPDIYKMSDIFVLPSTGEGFPTTVQEAMSSGLAVVTTNDPAYDMYHLSDTEIKLIEPTKEQIFATLDALAKDSNLIREIGKSAREYAVDHFSSEVNADILQKIYKGLL